MQNVHKTQLRVLGYRSKQVRDPSRVLKFIYLYDILLLLNKQMFKGEIQHFGLLTPILIIVDDLHYYVKGTVNRSLKIKKKVKKGRPAILIGLSHPSDNVSVCLLFRCLSVSKSDLQCVLCDCSVLLTSC